MLDKFFLIPSKQGTFFYWKKKTSIHSILKVGLQLESEIGDSIVTAVITKISGQEVTLDANHPLAGKTLIFDIEVVGLTKAVDIPLPISENRLKKSLPE